MVDLHDEGGSAAVHAVDHREVPQRPSNVEGLAGLLPGQVEELAHRTGCREPHTGEVTVKAQVGDRHPVRDAGTARHDAAAEAGERLDRVGHAAPQPVDVGRPVEYGDGHDRRPEHRIALDHPQHSFGAGEGLSWFCVHRAGLLARTIRPDTPTSSRRPPAAVSTSGIVRSASTMRSRWSPTQVAISSTLEGTCA